MTPWRLVRDSMGKPLFDVGPPPQSPKSSGLFLLPSPTSPNWTLSAQALATRLESPSRRPLVMASTAPLTGSLTRALCLTDAQPEARDMQNKVTSFTVSAACPPVTSLLCFGSVHQVPTQLLRVWQRPLDDRDNSIFTATPGNQSPEAHLEPPWYQL